MFVLGCACAPAIVSVCTGAGVYAARIILILHAWDINLLSANKSFIIMFSMCVYVHILQKHRCIYMIQTDTCQAVEFDGNYERS